MQIVAKLIQITNNIKTSYVKQYGDLSSWDFSTQDIYLLNCDSEIQHFLKKNKIVIHEDVYSIGVSLGIILIKRQVIRSFFRDFGPDLDNTTKIKMYEEIQERVYNYIINGEKDAH
jgi:hypothetical protein